MKKIKSDGFPATGILVMHINWQVIYLRSVWPIILKRPHLFFYLFIYLFIYLTIYLSIYLDSLSAYIELYRKKTDMFQ